MQGSACKPAGGAHPQLGPVRSVRHDLRCRDVAPVPVPALAHVHVEVHAADQIALVLQQPHLLHAHACEPDQAPAPDQALSAPRNAPVHRLLQEVGVGRCRQAGKMITGGCLSLAHHVTHAEEHIINEHDPVRAEAAGRAGRPVGTAALIARQRRQRAVAHLRQELYPVLPLGAREAPCGAIACT